MADATQREPVTSANVVVAAVGFALLLLAALVSGFEAAHQGFASIFLGLAVVAFWIPVGAAFGYLLLQRSQPAIGAIVGACLLPIGSCGGCTVLPGWELDHNDALAQRLLVGLEAWHEAHAEYPETLEALVPDYVDALPRASVGIRSQQFAYVHRKPDERLTYESACLVVPHVWWLDCRWCASDRGTIGPYCDD